ncbi:hypothetical protein U1Q18_010610 [Sarracenia purpurea var. burkii]
MRAKTPSPNPHTNPPHNHTLPPFSTLHFLKHPLLPKLGLPTSSLHHHHHHCRRRHLPSAAPEVGFPSLPQKGVKIWAPSLLLEVQVPLPPAAAAGSRQRSGGSTVGRRGEESVCQKEDEKKATR